jgi:hypothetical protein
VVRNGCVLPTRARLGFFFFFCASREGCDDETLSMHEIPIKSRECKFDIFKTLEMNPGRYSMQRAFRPSGVSRGKKDSVLRPRADSRNDRCVWRNMVT